jgi:hypothetical protein
MRLSGYSASPDIRGGIYGGKNMRILAAIFALTFVMATSALAMDEALTEQQVEGVEAAIKAMPGGCTVEDTNIEAEDGGYEADDVICEDGRYDVYLDGDFGITKKVKED